MSTVITATEAKTAAIKDLDIRSRYSGTSATGTVTDSVVVASTGKGPLIELGGPSSKLGNIVAFCTRNAVREAINNQNESLPSRSVLERLKERHLPIEKLASELSKIKSLNIDEKSMIYKLTLLLKNEPLFASILTAAMKIDDDIERKLIPCEFGGVKQLTDNFGEFLLSKKCTGTVKTAIGSAKKEDYDSINLPPFLKQALVWMMISAPIDNTTENLK